MKKIYYFILVLGFIFTACEPLEDIYNEIDSQGVLDPRTTVGSDEYTLTDDDYDALDLGYGSFSSESDAKTMIPGLLSSISKYDYWTKNSSILVNYQLYVGNAPGVRDYTYADTFTFANQDYPGYTDNAFALYPDENPSDAIAAKYPNAQESDVVLVKFKQFTTEPVAGITNLLDAGFNGDLSGFETINVLGSKDWYASGYGDDQYAKISAYGNGINEDWLISPEVDLTSQSNLTLQINQTAKYVSDRWDLLNVLISSNYTGDQATADWDVINIQTLPTGNDYVFVNSEEIDLIAYEGKKIHIAFKYETTETVAATWEINSVTIKTPGVEGETSNKELFYNFTDGSWTESEGVYFISDTDFDSMGLNSFGSGANPVAFAEDYLPTFLNLKFPYAQEEDELIVIYDYVSSSSGAQLRGNLYTKDAGKWSGFQSTISTSLQFGFDGATWIPDNTIKYTLVRNADYEYMASVLTEAEYAGLIGNLGKYGDFDYNWTDAQIHYALSLFLDHHDASADEGQKYILTYVIYDNGENDYTTSFIKQNGAWVVND